jgi:hypothetical protein
MPMRGPVDERTMACLFRQGGISLYLPTPCAIVHTQNMSAKAFVGTFHGDQ